LLYEGLSALEHSRCYMKDCQP